MLSSPEARRRNSFIGSLNNPLSKASSSETNSSSKINTPSVVSTSNSKPIKSGELTGLINSLKELDDNEERLDFINSQMPSFTFTTAQILSILGCTPSKKTKLKIVGMLGPRSTDPAQSKALLDEFTYVEDKNYVSEVLSLRGKALSRSRARVAEGGGRGRGRGRGAGRGRSLGRGRGGGTGRCAGRGAGRGKDAVVEGNVRMSAGQGRGGLLAAHRVGARNSFAIFVPLPPLCNHEALKSR